MNSIHYTIDEHVAILTLNHDDNRFNNKFLLTFLDTLDEIENNTKAKTLIVTSSHNKIFSNGIDLEWLKPIINSNKIDKAKDFFYLLNKLFKKILTYPLISIVAINGHAFAGGAILCCAFDFRLMRLDRGYFCLPEIDLGIPFLPGMNALLKKAMPMYIVEYMEFTGIRLTAEDCKKNHIVTEIHHIDYLMQQSITFAKTIKKNRKITGKIKKRLHENIINVIELIDPQYIELGKFGIK